MQSKNTMRAVVIDRQLAFQANYPKPRAVEGECLVRVLLVGISGIDRRIAIGNVPFSGVIGHEMVGLVEVGPLSLVGKRVACEVHCICRKCDLCLSGLSAHCRNRTVIGIRGRDGCFADFLSVPQRNLHVIPDTLSDEEAVFVEPLAAAYQVLTQCPISERTKVTVVGAGRLGLLTAQVLFHAGCKLTVVGRNRGKLLFCEKKGIQAIHADDVIPERNGEVVVDCSGTSSGLELAMEMVRPRGTIILKSMFDEPRAIPLTPIVENEIRLLGSRGGPFPEAIKALARQAIDVSSMITKVLPIERAVEAFAVMQQPDCLKVLMRVNAR